MRCVVGGEELREALLKNQSPELNFSNKKELGKKGNRSSEPGQLGKRNPSMCFIREGARSDCPVCDRTEWTGKRGQAKATKQA